jgi:hypothetical protein
MYDLEIFIDATSRHCLKCGCAACSSLRTSTTPTAAASPALAQHTANASACHQGAALNLAGDMAAAPAAPGSSVGPAAAALPSATDGMVCSQPLNSSLQIRTAAAAAAGHQAWGSLRDSCSLPLQGSVVISSSGVASFASQQEGAPHSTR